MANSTAQDEYIPIKIARSDTNGWLNLDHNALNPKEDQDIQQLERWEVIIGGHLAFQLALPNDKRQYKLDGFPKGYELRCAIRKDGGRDYYLYGHPASPKATYRTPGDFVLHLLWLVSDSDKRSDCSCDLCCRMVAAQAQAQAQAQQQAQLQARQQAQAQAQAQAEAKAEAKAKAILEAQKQLQQQSPGPFTANRDVYPTGIPGVKALSNVFRVGEMVWYKSQAWRLGVIMSIDQNAEGVEGDDHAYTFNLAPLGHRSLNQKIQLKQAVDMRPFLTFSVPDITLQLPPRSDYHRINWENLALQYTGSNQLQMLGLEASKMAARSINDSYSASNPIAQSVATLGHYPEQIFMAVYFGAELICLNDPIRVSVPSGRDSSSSVIMRLSEIKAIAQPNGFGSYLEFRGDTFRLVRMPLPLPPDFIPPETIGYVFAEEVALRNQIEQDKSVRWGWELVQEKSVVHEREVHGRFYVTDKLMNVIDPNRFQTSAQNGVIEEAQAYLNNRGYAGEVSVLIRHKNRAEALGEAVSVDFVPPKGMIEFSWTGRT